MMHWYNVSLVQRHRRTLRSVDISATPRHDVSSELLFLLKVLTIVTTIPIDKTIFIPITSEYLLGGTWTYHTLVDTTPHVEEQQWDAEQMLRMRHDFSYGRAVVDLRIPSWVVSTPGFRKNSWVYQIKRYMRELSEVNNFVIGEILVSDWR